MKNFILIIVFGFLSFTFPSSAINSPPPQIREDTFQNLLPKEELEQIKREALRQSQLNEKVASINNGGEELKQSQNPYAAILKDQDLKPQTEEKKESLPKKIVRSKRYSPSGDSYKRYGISKNRPGDSFKSTPSQRAFGR